MRPVGACTARRGSTPSCASNGIRVGRKRVARLMKAAGISGIRPRKRWRTTIRVPGVEPATDLVKRQFRPSGPNLLWVADITYLRTGEGWFYLAAVQDTYSRQIVGWSMATHMRSTLVVDALRMALARRRPQPGLIHHSDQGSQGGFRWSSQRLGGGGCDGCTEAAFGPGPAGEVPFAWPARGGTA
jgi:putative transposase